MSHRIPPRSLPRVEDVRFLTGEGRFTADLHRDGALHAAVVRSEHPHGVLEGIATEAARAAPEVVAVHTAADLEADGVGPLPCVAELSDGSPLAVPPRHALASGRVRHVGEPVALVLARSRQAALDAAERVEVQIEPLPAVTDALQALAADAPQLWPEVPGNQAFHFRSGDVAATRAAFDAAAHVVELSLPNHRVSALPLEPRAGLAWPGEGGEPLTLLASAQGVHDIRAQVAGPVLGMAPESIRITAPDVGGGFGLKNFLYPEWVLLLWAARRHRRAVRWVAERGEDLAGAAHGRDVHARARLALDASGRFLALEASLTANMGAFLSGTGPAVTTKALPTAMGGVYDIAHVCLESRGAFTNTAPVDAYRGAGKPEANYLIERLVDAAARRCGFDPVELRLRNAVHRFPHRTALGMCIDGGGFAANVKRAAALADRAGFAARREASARAGRLRGLGFGCFLETARGFPQECAEVRFAAGGAVELRLGTESNGQGHETAFAQIAAGLLGLPLASFRFVQADTARLRSGHGHGGARSMHMGGAALSKAVAAVLAKARPVAARLLQAQPADLVFEDGVFSVPASGRSVGLLEVAAAARELDGAGDGEAGGIDAAAQVEDAPFTFPNGCHAAEVEIERDTGVVHLLRYLCVDDYGALVNPRLAQGQVHGGVAQGIGQALLEQVAYDPDSGQLLSGSLMDYALPGATLLPAFEVHLQGTRTAANPLGVKGTGQAGAIAAPQAILNAVADALAPLGVEHVDMPATPERLWRAMRAAHQSAPACDSSQSRNP